MLANTITVNSDTRLVLAYATMGGMGTKPLGLSRSDAEVASILDCALRDSDLSLRRLADLSGVRLTRLGDVLRRGRAMTVGELDAISEALGLVGWQVLREAERLVAVEQDTGFDPSGWGVAAQHEPGIEEDEAAL